jgi:hypothetical protein
MGELFELLTRCLHDAWVAVSGIDDSDTGTEVDPATTFDVPYFGILSAFGKDAVRLCDAARQGGRATGHQRGVGLQFHVSHGIHGRFSCYSIDDAQIPAMQTYFISR